MIANKNQLIYSLNASISELSAVINDSISKNEEKSQEVYYRLGTVLLWIGSCLDRIEDKTNNNHMWKNIYDKNYAQAFMGAYNAQKHSVLLYKMDGFIGGSTFPYVLPVIIGNGNYFWKALGSNAIFNLNQIEMYNYLLSGKPILQEIKKIRSIILNNISNY